MKVFFFSSLAAPVHSCLLNPVGGEDEQQIDDAHHRGKPTTAMSSTCSKTFDHKIYIYFFFFKTRERKVTHVSWGIVTDVRCQRVPEMSDGVMYVIDLQTLSTIYSETMTRLGT